MGTSLAFSGLFDTRGVDDKDLCFYYHLKCNPAVVISRLARYKEKARSARLYIVANLRTLKVTGGTKTSGILVAGSGDPGDKNAHALK